LFSLLALAPGKKIPSTFAAVKAVIEYILKIDFGDHSRLVPFVDSLYEHVSILEDWKAMADLLQTDSSNKAFREVKAFLPRDSDEEAVLAHLLVCCLKKGSGIIEVAELDTKISLLQGRKKAKDLNSEFQAEFSPHFARVLPELFSQFKSDPAVLTALVEIPCLMNLDTFSTLKSNKGFGSIPKIVGEMVATENELDLLQSCCKTLRALQSHQSTGTQVNAEISQLMDNLVQQLEERTDAVKNFDGDEADFNTSLVDLSASLLRLNSVVNQVDLTSDEVSFEKKGELFDLVLDLAGSHDELLREEHLDEVKGDEKLEREKVVDEVWLHHFLQQ